MTCAGRPPNEFPQDRMQINFKDVVDVSPQMAAALEGLLEPLLEDRVTAKDALALLSGKANQQTQISRQATSPLQTNFAAPSSCACCSVAGLITLQ